jgi:hypothetical protein
MKPPEGQHRRYCCRGHSPDAALIAAQEKATLETKVADLERNLATTRVDLATADYQFSQVTNQHQVVSEEATWLQESNAKSSEDLEGESSRHFLSPSV